MQIENTIPDPDLIKLFTFLDSDTPATWEWVIGYFSKHGVAFPRQHNPYENLSSQVAKFTARAYLGDKKAFARKMRSAYGVRKHRKNKDVVTLSISLDKATSGQLSLMSKGRKKTEVVSQLINNNYQEFLAREDERRYQLAEAKKKRDLEKQLKKPIKLTETKLQTDGHGESSKEELQEAIAALYEIIFSANENCRKISYKCLLKATKIYYTAFLK
jgi:hypothetical protein